MNIALYCIRLWVTATVHTAASVQSTYCNCSEKQKLQKRAKDYTTKYPQSQFCQHRSSRGMGKVISYICDFVHVCPCSKRKMAWATNTKLCKHTVHGRPWSRIDSDVKGQGHKVIEFAAGEGMQYACKRNRFFSLRLTSGENGRKMMHQNLQWEAWYQLHGNVENGGLECLALTWVNWDDMSDSVLH